MNRNNIAIGYLRAFVTMLVLLFHSVIAYTTFVPRTLRPFDSVPYYWGPFPVVDVQRWAGFDLFVVFNESFFMSLMFLLSGLFVYPSLVRKGGLAYLRDRFVRLGLPFALYAAVLSPLAYYPSYLLRGGEPSVASYVQAWSSLDTWVSGPVWFVAVLLGLDILAVLLHRFFPKAIVALGQLGNNGAQRPLRFFFGLLCASAIAYASLRLAFGPLRWFTFGPFAIQSARILLYPLFFFTGVGIGAWGIERGLLAPDGLLARHWRRWLPLAIIAFVLELALMDRARIAGAATPISLNVACGLAYVLACCAISFLLLALFVRFAKRRVAIFDSLSDNAYGMYLLHYVFVIWIQYAMLDLTLPAFPKGMIVFTAVLLASWLSTAAIRRIPFAARILTSGTQAARALPT
jgi:hypothetical protein